MIEIIEEKRHWDNFVSNFEKSDLYHTFDYHHITKGEHKPVLVRYCDGQACIGLPLLIRKIPGTTFYDATSVYGYPGPLCKNISADFDNTTFSKELREYLIENNIVSVFSRLNPFMPLQHKALENIGCIGKKGVIVSIDLKKDIEQQRMEFGRRLKGQLNKVRRHCFVKKANSDEELQDFIEIYRENMDRVNADPMYYFDDSYFRVLAKSDSFHTETLLAVHKDSGETIGASMFIYKNSIAHYHLSGTRNDYLSLMPTKLLIDEMRIKATEMGLAQLNLGGGLSSANDSLLRFKSSFSKNLMDFYVWKLVVLPQVYDDLVCNRVAANNVDFFPLYRY